MKKYFLATAMISLSMIGCKKSELNVETVENSDGTVTTTTVEKERTTTLDSVQIDARVDQATEKFNEVADEAGKTFKQAGEDVKAAAVKGAEKVDQETEKIKADLKKK